MGAGFLASLIFGRWMEPGEFGRFAFCLSVVTLLDLVIEFGFFPAGARVLALAKDELAERRALGSLVLIALAVGAVLALVVAALAIPIDLIFKTDVRWLLVATASFAFFRPFQSLVEQSCQGLNQIRRLSIFQLLLSSSYLVMLAGLALSNRLTAGSALVANLTGIGLASVWSLSRLRPRFDDLSRYIKVTLKESRGYGANVYLARLTGAVATQFDNLVVTYFAGTPMLGLYALAQKLSNPISTISRTLAITRFRAFAKLDSVPKRIIRWNAVVLVVLAIGLALFGPFALKILFPKYSQASNLLLPFAAFSLFSGLFQPYNMFLASHGRGAEIRNIAVIVSIATLAGLLLAVPRYGVMGAAWTGAAAMALDYLLHLHYYRRFKRSLNEKSVSAPGVRRSVLLLDLSGDKRAADAWASERFPGSEIQPINKTDLKWGSKREALARVRAIRPDTFAVFSADLNLQSAPSAIVLFSALAGARRVVIEDGAGRSVSRSRIGALLIEAPRYGLEIAVGYGVLIPLSLLLTLLLRVMLPFRKIVRNDRRKESFDEASRKVLHIRATLASSTEGGMTSHVKGFASGAADLGHHLTFLSVGEGQKQISHESDRDHIVIKPTATLSATRAILELWNNLSFTFNSLRLIRSGAITPDSLDFIYQRYSRFNFTGVALSLATGLPLAIEYNGSEVWRSLRWDPVGQIWLLKRFERLNMTAADLIFVVSEVESRNLIRAGIHSKRIIINPNGVNTELFRPGKGGDRVRSALGVEGKIVIGFVGTFGPWHGAPVLAEAATKTNKASSCHFLFVGDGDQRSLAESIIERGGAGARTTFAGRVPHGDMPDYLAACDILISPHVESEDGSEFFGSPTKLFEYMASARPIVASGLGQIAEIIVDGENGLLVEPGDSDALARAIELLAEDEVLRTRLGAAARQTVIEQYTWRHNAARVFDAMNCEL